MYRPLENGPVPQTIRERLQAPDMQRKFVYAEGERVAYFDSRLPAQKPVGDIILGPQVTSRLYDRVFWIAPKTSLMNNPRDMRTLLDQVGKGLFSYSTPARIVEGNLVYERRDFWEGPNRCLNVELVALPHRKILEMLQNYFVNKDDLHPVMNFEDSSGLAFGVTKDQLRVLQEQDKNTTQPRLGTFQFDTLAQNLQSLLKRLRA